MTRKSVQVFYRKVDDKWTFRANEIAVAGSIRISLLRRNNFAIALDYSHVDDSIREYRLQAAVLTDAYPFQLEDFDPDEDTITSEIIEPALNLADRSIARRACLQILYELDTTRHPVAGVIDAHIYERPESYNVRQIIRQIVRGVIEHREVIDSLIQRFAPEWPVDQVAVVDRNILRIAVFEHLLQGRTTPIPVIINEAVHLAQLFGAENSHSFVHGVLGSITLDESIALSETSEKLDTQ